MLASSVGVFAAFDVFNAVGAGFIPRALVVYKVPLLVVLSCLRARCSALTIRGQYISIADFWLFSI